MPLWTLLLALGAPAPAAAADSPPAELQKLLQNCDAHKFETLVTTTVDGEPRSSKVKLCGNQGQSDEAWLHTLKDAAEKTAANGEMPRDVRKQIVTALNAEIARLEAPVPPPPPGRVAHPAPADNSFARDYASLPPLPDKPAIEAAPGAAVAAATSGLAAAPVKAVPLPRLTFSCPVGPDVRTGAACDVIERGSMLLVRADEAFSSNLQLQFVRRGDPRGEVQLRPMKSSQTVAVPFPNALCAGVVRSRVEFRVSRPGGGSVTSFGPYELRC
ncbi:MAG: hypothetical protein V4502_07430 [Pseudomonadota bacterium]